MELYSLRRSPTKSPDEFTIVKFDGDLEIESIYYMTKTSCNCPGFEKLAPKGQLCKHLKMFGFFERERHIGDGWMFDLHTRQWRTPIMHKDIQEQLELHSYEDPLMLGSDEDRLAEKLAPALATEGSFTPVAQPTPHLRAKPIDDGSFKRRKF